jgi:hypothetical protein
VRVFDLPIEADTKVQEERKKNPTGSSFFHEPQHPAKPLIGVAL